MTNLALKGCTYEPMSSYLSALAVLRLVSEQKDPDAKGWWDDLGVFHLDSCLDEEGLVNFFLEEYRPTPIVSPWNRGSGFYGGDKKKKSINAILNNKSKRLTQYRETLESVFEIIEKSNVSKSNIESKKNDLIILLREQLSDPAVEWIDASTLITPEEKSVYPPILGSGGNDGNLEFSNKFMDYISSMFAAEDTVSKNLLENAIFDFKTDKLQKKIRVGQFEPGRTGGSNQGDGIENGDKYTANPWKLILTIEGTILWSGSIAKRNNPLNNGNMILTSPFTVKSVQVGFNSSFEDGKSRAEIWTPLWKNPTGYKELKSFLAEGRANVGRKNASNSIEFAEAVSSLGINRGVSNFVRYNLLERRGNNYIALPTGTFDVRYRKESDLIRELNPLLFQIDSDFRKRENKNKSIPASFKSARRKIDEKIFETLLHGDRKNIIKIVSAIGQLEKLVSLSANSAEPIIQKPVSGLSPRWIKFADDGSLEVRIAAAIASIGSTGGVGSIRANISLVDPAKETKNLQRVKGQQSGTQQAKQQTAKENKNLQWVKGRGQFAWEGNSLYAKLSSVLVRRMMDAERLGVKQNPLWGAIRLSVEDINAFIEGQIDESLVEDLIFGFSWINWNKKGDVAELNKSLFENGKRWNNPVKSGVISRPYALLKLLFLPDDIPKGGTKISLKPEPSIIPLLRAGRIKDACTIADRRLRTQNFVPVTTSFYDGDNGLRISAALLIPVRDEWRLKKLVLREEQDKN